MDVVVYSLATLAVLVLLSSILLVRRYVRRYRVSDFEHAEIIRSLLEHNCGIVALTDGSGVINSTSHEFDKLFTPVGRRARVRSISDLLTERATHDYMSILDYIRRERRPILDLDITTLAGQTERNMTLTVTPVPSSGHSITSLINTFAYPKQPEQIETDLGHMEKLTNIGQITAGIAHELNTPLGSIILLTDVIGDTFTGSVPEEIHKIKAHAEHCSKVVRELLGYVRRGDGVKEKHDICGIIGKVKALVAAEVESRAIQIDINTADDEHSIVCNENQIEQLFFNLFANAIHAIQRNGAITVDTTRDAILNQIVVTFRDNGGGILPEHIGKVFDPFFTTKPGSEGTGLGLALCKKIALAHGGRIKVESRVKRGTTFTLCIPAAP